MSNVPRQQLELPIDPTSTLNDPFDATFDICVPSFRIPINTVVGM